MSTITNTALTLIQDSTGEYLLLTDDVHAWLNERFDMTRRDVANAVDHWREHESQTFLGINTEGLTPEDLDPEQWPQLVADVLSSGRAWVEKGVVLRLDDAAEIRYSAGGNAILPMRPGSSATWLWADGEILRTSQGWQGVQDEIASRADRREGGLRALRAAWDRRDAAHRAVMHAEAALVQARQEYSDAQEHFHAVKAARG